mgnify:CR=1 FL=1
MSVLISIKSSFFEFTVIGNKIRLFPISIKEESVAADKSFFINASIGILKY